VLVLAILFSFGLQPLDGILLVIELKQKYLTSNYFRSSNRTRGLISRCQYPNNWTSIEEECFKQLSPFRIDPDRVGGFKCLRSASPTLVLPKKLSSSLDSPFPRIISQPEHKTGIATL